MDVATATLRAEYDTEVQRIVEELLHSNSPLDSLLDPSLSYSLDQLVRSSYFLESELKSRLTLFLTDSPDDFLLEVSPNSLRLNYSFSWRDAAFFALRADVVDHLHEKISEWDLQVGCTEWEEIPELNLH